MAELVHVVTDPRRFERPLSMTEALEKAREWWDARETEQVAPTARSVDQFWEWMAQHRLGRKRLLDTMLAATYHSHGVRAILTSDARDYAVFGCFEVISPG
jgi:predicted nucleic acid-binding protein